VVIKREERELKKKKNSETVRKTQEVDDIYKPWRDVV
jgi:hypothetical protein